MQDATPWDDFDRTVIETTHGPLYVRQAGQGRPLLLLHGFPQTGHTFRDIAPTLSKEFKVVVPDLPGYGRSPGPPAKDDGTPFDKRSVARSMAALMSMLGAERFLLLGHDRGARVAYRLALDMPEKVQGLVSLDTVPTVTVWEAMTYRSAVAGFHWPLLAQPRSVVLPILAGASDAFIGHLLDDWAHIPLSPDAREHYLAAYREKTVQEGAWADYRAGIGPDLAADIEDRTVGRKLRCPLLVPYGRYYTKADPADAWADFADNVRSVPLDCGHFIAEEAPEPLLPLLMKFFQNV